MIFRGGSAALAGQTMAKSTDILPATSVRPETLIAAGDIPKARRAAMLASASKFYRFWNTGDEGLLREAISDRFVDHTLPPGRPQGPPGPPAASRAVLAAAPHRHDVT